MPQRLTLGDSSGLPRGLPDELDQVDLLMRRRRLDEAGQLLADLDRRFPNQPEVIGRRMNLASAAGNLEQYAEHVARLARLEPDEPDYTLALASAYEGLGWNALAQQTFARFVNRFPDHPRAGDARAQIELLDEVMQRIWAELGRPGPLDKELLAKNEELQTLLSKGAWAQAIPMAEGVLRRYPDFVSLRNNLSLAYLTNGQTARAIEAANTVLAQEPDNFHALGNLTRFLVLNGQIDEARLQAARLKAIPVTTVDIAAKQTESLSFLGDDEGVLAAFEAVKDRLRHQGVGSQSALVYHLAAAASLRLGQEQNARRLWRTALELMPGFELAQGNMADLKRPVDERHGPWAYTVQYWLPHALIEDLGKELSSRKKPDDDATRQIARRFLSRHPHLIPLAPLLLERGDDKCREFVLAITGMAKTPELLDALQNYALGQYGSTDNRMQAMRLVQEAGLLPSGTVRFWQSGQWREIIVFGYELHGEPVGPQPPPEVARLQERASLAMRNNDPVKAERLLKQALVLMPDELGLLNNLAGAYGAQGRNDEAETLVRTLHERDPDYLFARTNLANFAVLKGNPAEAQALIDPLLKRTRLHFSEFAALMAAQVNVFLAQGNTQAAKTWLEMWEQATPDHPHIPLFRNRLAAAPKGSNPQGQRVARGRQAKK